MTRPTVGSNRGLPDSRRRRLVAPGRQDPKGTAGHMAHKCKATLLEAVVVVAVAVVLGLTANAVGGRGLAIGRDHFRRPAWTPPVPPSTGAEKSRSAGRTGAEAAGGTGAEVVGRNGAEAAGGPAEALPLDDEGFQLLSHDEVVDLQQSAAYLEERCIFIDARNDAHYKEGHIPGAFQLDHYRAERYLPDLVPICLNATNIVVYCNGGACEDSKLAANDLIEHGVNPQRISIYSGGATEWKRDGLPFERGSRLSGDLVYLEPD